MADPVPLRPGLPLPFTHAPRASRPEDQAEIDRLLEERNLLLAAVVDIANLFQGDLNLTQVLPVVLDNFLTATHARAGFVQLTIPTKISLKSVVVGLPDELGDWIAEDGAWSELLKGAGPGELRPVPDLRTSSLPVPLIAVLTRSSFIGLVSAALADRDGHPLGWMVALFPDFVAPDVRRFSLIRAHVNLSCVAVQHAFEFERTLRERAQFEILLRDMSSAVISTDEEGRVTLFNPAAEALLGTPRQLAVGYPIEHVLQGGGSDLLPLFQQALQQGSEVWSAERPVRPLGSKEMSVSVGVRLLRGRDRASAGVVGIFHDVTRFKELEKMKSDFVANVSHELRTPLMAIRGSLGILLQGIEGPISENQMKFLRITDRNAVRLVELITDLLDLSKIEAGRFELSFSRGGLTALARDVVASLSSLAREKSIMLALDPDAPPCEAEFDERAIRRVIVNLVSNAIKFTPQGGWVAVSTIEEAATVTVEVRDSGLGIKEADLGRLFQKFERLDEARTQGIGGTGLGLALVREVVDLHGGMVLVTSAHGQGSTFTVRLPRGSMQSRAGATGGGPGGGGGPA
ncbi:MAG: PAS domain S-box protein [Planctomycetes bacterium]|nr:PAS domain S-box protein [Planctomycetota bacterium]